MSEIFKKSTDRDRITAILALCTALSSGFACNEQKDPSQEAIIELVRDGGVSACPVDLECSLGKNFRTGLNNCIDFSRCELIGE